MAACTQALFNYFVLFVNRNGFDVDYLGVIALDFNSRSLQCLTNDIAATIQRDRASFSTKLQHFLFSLYA